MTFTSTRKGPGKKENNKDYKDDDQNQENNKESKNGDLELTEEKKQKMRNRRTNKGSSGNDKNNNNPTKDSGEKEHSKGDDFEYSNQTKDNKVIETRDLELIEEKKQKMRNSSNGNGTSSDGKNRKSVNSGTDTGEQYHNKDDNIDDSIQTKDNNTSETGD